MIDGVPHATRQAIGEWLEYADPQKGIAKLLGRNPYIETCSVILKLRANDGKNYDTRVYHPQGFLLICMESQTEKSKRMKDAIADFVWNHIKPAPGSLKDEIALSRPQRKTLQDLTRNKGTFGRQTLANRLQLVCRLLGEALPNPCLLGNEAGQRELNRKWK
ncbi:MAG: hypothetical protein HQL76_02485 [Magnetococcales bacterium]|nr:hypothetical protein [Magnetococcales bacterium]